jgi:beta-xylosidase
LLCTILTIALNQTALAQNYVPQWGDWKTWGDQRNGTYRNPVLPSDYSDVDCIRVGSDYYAISSTFQFSPGVIILHSKDMVNWTIVGHVVNDLTEIGPDMNWDKMNRYGKGVWAGGIRYHNGKFWVYFGTPDEGYFMSTAKHITGPWEPLHPILASKGWDDCCPFWDDDGQGYLIGTNYADAYKIHLFKLSADGYNIVKESDKVIHQSRGSEANKLYKINGWYYHFFSEVKAEGRVVMMERAKNIWGPYDEVKQLNHAEKQFYEPNQGGIVDTENGDWYFYTHHGTGDWSGRINSLLPLTWIDGWPIIGEVGADGIGRMKWQGKMPVKGTKVVTPQSSDDFNETTLPPQWEWNYQPRANKWSLTQRPGWLRLAAFKPIEQDNLLKAGNTLTQRVFRTAKNEVIVKMDVHAMANGGKAGLCHFNDPKHYSLIGIRCLDKVRSLEFRANGSDDIAGPVITVNVVWLRSTWGLDGLSHYSYSTDGKTFTDFGNAYQLAWGSYRGDRIGLFNYNNNVDEGYIDADYFNYTYSHN